MDKRFQGKTVAVTGSHGFIGGHLVEKLIDEGATVIGIDNLITGSTVNNPRNIAWYEVDITDYDEVDRVFSKVKPEIVFHTAAIARTPWTVSDPVLAHKVNATGTLNMLEVSRKHGVKRFVHSSSCILYVPFTPYYVSKLSAEEYVKIYPKLYGLSTIALRYSNVYGTRQSEEGPSPNVFAALRKAKKEHGKLFITGDGEQTRDYIHVSDVVEANALAGISESNDILDICTGVSTSLNECAKHFECPIEYIPNRVGDIKHISSDPRPAERIIGFKSQVKLEDGIKDVL